MIEEMGCNYIRIITSVLRVDCSFSVSRKPSIVVIGLKLYGNLIIAQKLKGYTRIHVRNFVVCYVFRQILFFAAPDF